ncbi:hypothetical protein WH43_02460 [Rheinheimera sp. KL1]|uniref:hypothetical protein n=1 Tax=Rheinheimera sp. KL1 TaxID=1635005 RepID=UPI0006A9619F|nr:hypothetical protein [Rheinheimera sp. KL1]KOO59646.1 hypothetical protein WH43_02460 [Rheinheimera sp. KL1]
MISKKDVYPNYVYFLICLGLIGVGGVIFSIPELTLDVLNKVAGILSFFITLMAAIFAYMAIDRWKKAREYDTEQAHKKAIANSKLKSQAKLRFIYSKSCFIVQDNAGKYPDFNTRKAVCLAEVLRVYRAAILEIGDYFDELNYTEQSLTSYADLACLPFDKSSLVLLGIKEMTTFQLNLDKVCTDDELIFEVGLSMKRMFDLINSKYK